MNVLTSLKLFHSFNGFLKSTLKTHVGLVVQFYSRLMLALNRVSRSGQFTPGTRYVVGCVSPTAGLDYFKEITHCFVLKYFLYPNFLRLRDFWLIACGTLAVVVLDKCHSSPKYQAYNNYILCGSVNKTSGNNMQRHIKENNKCTLVVELKFFVLFYSRRLSTASS